MADLSRARAPGSTRRMRTRQVSWREVQSLARRHGRRIRADYDLLVAILRAGSPVATVLSQQTGLPIDYLVCRRRDPEPFFLDNAARPARTRRILLVDDVCDSGWTFARCRRYCETPENQVGTFSVFRSNAPGRFVPDFSMPADPDETLRWPWEAGHEDGPP